MILVVLRLWFTRDTWPYKCVLTDWLFNKSHTGLDPESHYEPSVSGPTNQRTRLGWFRPMPRSEKQLNFIRTAYISEVTFPNCGRILFRNPTSFLLSHRRRYSIQPTDSVEEKISVALTQRILIALHVVNTTNQSVLTGCAVVQHRCKGDQPFQSKSPNFDPHIPQHP